MSKKVNLTTQVYEKIKAKILNNKLKPNEYLDEKQICEQLGVSRTPVREALVQLEWEGFVVSNPHRGVSVSDLSLPIILELIHIRKVMEPELLRPYLKHYSRDVLLDFRAKMSAALEEKDMDMLHDLDYAFHRYLYEATKRPHIMKLLSYVCDQSQRIRTQDFYQLRRTEEGAAEHIAMIDALLAGEYDKVPEMLRAHAASMEEKYYQNLLDYFQNQGDR